MTFRKVGQVHPTSIFSDQTAGLFIYASTAVKFIDSENHLLTERLNLITSLPSSTFGGGSSGIGDLCSQVPERVSRDVHPDDEGPYARFRFVVGEIVLVFTHLLTDALSSLL